MTDLGLSSRAMQCRVLGGKSGRRLQHHVYKEIGEKEKAILFSDFLVPFLRQIYFIL